MPTVSEYDPIAAPIGGADRSLYACATLLAGLPKFQELSETADAEAAMAQIFLGIGPQPWDKVEFTKDELDNLLCLAQLQPKQDDTEDEIVNDGGVLGTPAVTGSWELMIRRVARASELNDRGPSLLWLWFYGYCKEIARDLVVASQQVECPYISKIRFTNEAAYSSLGGRAAQGEYLWCKMEISHGFPAEGG